MKGNRDGQEPWTEDDLFDLDSALEATSTTSPIFSAAMSRRLNERPMNAICRSPPRSDGQPPDPRKQERRRPGKGEGKQRPVACLLKGSTPLPLPQVVTRAIRGSSAWAPIPATTSTAGQARGWRPTRADDACRSIARLVPQPGQNTSSPGRRADGHAPHRNVHASSGQR
jgi:hypothetical protein